MSLLYAIHRLKSALQIKLIKPTYNDKGYIERSGAILLEAAAGENKVYDWSNNKKVTFAICESDLDHLYDEFNNVEKTGKINVKLIHDKNAGTDKSKEIKTLTITNGEKSGTFFLNINAPNNKVGVSLDKGALIKFMHLMRQSLGVIVGLTQ